jgi:hypothetical protein
MVLSCTAILLIGWTAGLGVKKKPIRVILVVIGLIVGTGVFSLWYQSLYSGENLGTRYVWNERPPMPIPNLAYGKPAHTSTIMREISPNLFYSDIFLNLESSGRAVDGERKAGSGFVSNFERNPFWVVDLHRPEQIDSIVIFENRQSPSWNVRPLIVAFSDDQKNWRTAASITNENPANPLRLEFTVPQKVRYVKLRATGTCNLALDEVEIFPPAGVRIH